MAWTPADQQILEIAKLINKGVDYRQAMYRVWGQGVEVSLNVLRGDIARAAGRAGLFPENQAILRAAGRNAGSGMIKRAGLWALNALRPAGLGTVAGVSAGTVAAGVVVGALVLGAAGIYWVNNGDQPVLAGPSINGAGTPNPNLRGGDTKTYNGDKYGVYLLPGVSGGSIVVAQESELKKTPTCRFPGGGLCTGNDAPVTYELKSSQFNTHEQATAQWCKDLAGAKTTYWPVARDSTAEVYGGKYWIGTAPACPKA